VLVALAVLAVLLVSLAAPAQAAVSVSRAEVSGTKMRIDGRATPSRPITVDGVAMATSSGSGSFRVDRSGYSRPADCTVDVNDGSATALNVRLSGCTLSEPTQAPSPTPTQTPSPTPTQAPSPTPPRAPTPTPSGAAALTSLSLNPASLQGGGTAAGTVALTAPAPAGGALVTLSSSNPAVVTVTATMTVPTGVSSFFALMPTRAVTTTTTAVISATYNGVTRTANLTVTPTLPRPTAALDLISLDPSTVQTGTVRTSATVYFTALTPSGGAVVRLSSSDSSIATVPPSITVPANSSTGAFEVTIPASAAGTATISATYSGGSRSAVLTVSAQSLFQISTEPPLPNARVGESYTGFVEACCGQGSPYTWSLVSGAVPDGLRFAGNDLLLTRSTGVTGVATRVQTTTFTVQAKDGAGNTATKTFSLTVDPASPLVINNGTDRLVDGQVGVAYETGLFPLGGVPPWSWSFVSGSLPPGLSVQASPGHVAGTPTTAGTFTFTVQVADSASNVVTGQFTIVVAP
jgi:hypothetical protein